MARQDRAKQERETGAEMIDVRADDAGGLSLGAVPGDH